MFFQFPAVAAKIHIKRAIFQDSSSTYEGFGSADILVIGINNGIDILASQAISRSAVGAVEHEIAGSWMTIFEFPEDA